MIKISTRRFGFVQRSEADVLTFPSGIFGFELHQRWLLLGDQEHGGLYWLQSCDQMDLSLSVVPPREFLDDYFLHVRREELRSIGRGAEPLIVLCVLTEFEHRPCVNLRNPLVINPHNRLGRQVVVCDDRPLQYELFGQVLPLRKCA